MPGRLRASFRIGNLSEHLGILLLKGLAAVAEVTRQEDVGVDAIATLLRPGQDGNCYAEQSFLVQIKSGKSKTIEYQDHELKWLTNQELPMFIGLVCLDSSEIALYSTVNILHAVLVGDARKVITKFGVSSIPGFFKREPFLRWELTANDVANVWLGEPVLKWGVSQLRDAEWAITAYGILKKFLEEMRYELVDLSLGQASVFSWQTNSLSSIARSDGITIGTSNLREKIGKQIQPVLKVLSIISVLCDEESGPALNQAINEFVLQLQKNKILDGENFNGSSDVIVD